MQCLSLNARMPFRCATSGTWRTRLDCCTVSRSEMWSTCHTASVGPHLGTTHARAGFPHYSHSARHRSISHYNLLPVCAMLPQPLLSAQRFITARARPRSEQQRLATRSAPVIRLPQNPFSFSTTVHSADEAVAPWATAPCHSIFKYKYVIP